MGKDEELEQRVALVEDELVVVRRETAEARALAAGTDRDVADTRAELRSHTRLLQALRQTQLDHYAEHKAELGELKAEVSDLKGGVRLIVRMLEGMGGRAG